MLSFENYRLLNVLNEDIKKGLNMKVQINDFPWSEHMKTHMGHLDDVNEIEILTKLYIQTII